MHRGKVDPGVSELPQGNELSQDHVNRPLDRQISCSHSQGGGHFNFICTGMCGHRIGRLTHPQTKAGTKTDPFSDYLQ